MARGGPPFDHHAHVVIYLSDGSVLTVQDVMMWMTVPHGIVAILAFFDATYPCWNTSASQWETRRYRNVVHSREYYWLVEGDTLFVENDKTGSLYPTVTNSTIKNGAWVPDPAWHQLMTRLFQTHTLPVETTWR
jgi:hypothetical protein